MAEIQSPQPAFDVAKMYIWVKGLESKVNNLVREVNLLKNDLMKKNVGMKKEAKALSDDFLQFKHEQEIISQKMDLIIKELKNTAGIEEMMTLRKYLEFWNPLNFVTQKDLDRAIEQKMNSFNIPRLIEKNEKEEEHKPKKEFHPFG